MKNLAQGLAAGNSAQFGVNPFAQALAETEHTAFDSVPTSSNLNPFSEALARAGSSLGSAVAEPTATPDLLGRHQAELQANQEKELLRQKLHDQVNPTDRTEVFDQENLKTAKALEKIRQELELFVEEVKKIKQDLAIATKKRVVNPGITGAYDYNFFHQLRATIRLWRQRAQSAATWKHVAKGKQAKVSKFRGGSPTSTKAVHDTLHHERKMAFAGG